MRSSTAVSARLSFRVNRSRMAGAISCTRASCGAIGELHVRAGHSDGLRAYTLAGLANLTSAAARNRGGLRLHGCVGAVCVCVLVWMRVRAFAWTERSPAGRTAQTQLTPPFLSESSPSGRSWPPSPASPASSSYCVRLRVRDHVVMVRTVR